MSTKHSLDGWHVGHAVDVEWVPWGQGGAKARVLASADGYVVALVAADRGYRGTPHEHTATEFLSVADGRIRTQGEVMEAGDAYAAATGAEHTEFEALTSTTYLSVFKV